jgi:hypothetical protein
VEFELGAHKKTQSVQNCYDRAQCLERFPVGSDGAAESSGRSLGLWRVASMASQTCGPWPEFAKEGLFDATWNFARACSLIGLISGVIAILAGLRFYMKGTHVWLMVAMQAFAAISSIIVFIGFSLDVCMDLDGVLYPNRDWYSFDDEVATTCTMGNGAITTAVAAVVWVLVILI